MDKVKMRVFALAYNSVSKTGAYVLILSDEENTVRVPFIIGMAEAQSIAIQLEGMKTQRPMTHDLMKALTDRLNVELVEVCVERFQVGVYYAWVVFREFDGKTFRLDARASDAISLALRYGCPIYMERKVVEEVGISTALFEETLGKEDGEEGRGSAERELSEDELNRLMEEAVKKEDYETASRYRDMLKAKKEKS